MYSKDNSKVTPDQLKTHLKSLKRDTVGVEEVNGKYRLNIARDYSRLHFKDEDGKPSSQKRVATGISVFDAKGKIDKSNADAIQLMTTRIHNDLIHGEGKNFDVTLAKYNIRLRAMPKDEPIAKKQKSLLELYDWYCENKKNIDETTLKLQLQGRWRRALVKALDAGNTEALDIRNYLINNGSLQIARNTLSILEHAYNFGIKHGECSNNPFVGMASEIRLGKKKKVQVNTNEDNDKRAFTVAEMDAIIEAFEQNNQRKHFAPIIKFLFWTGCRTGEAIGFQWQDVKWNKEVIVFCRTYNEELKVFKDTKTGVDRWIPMPKGGRLWNLLKSLPEGKPDEVVFKGKQGGIVSHKRLATTWTGSESHHTPGVIKQLVKEGKVSQYLKLYATRHTFITHQIHIHGVRPEVVASWCGHDEQMTKKSYLDRDRVTIPGEDATTINTTIAAGANNAPNQLLADKLANLTPEQIDKLMSLLTQ